MSEGKKNRVMLAKHHRDSEAFAKLMKQTIDGRFNEKFLAIWEETVCPYLTDSSVVSDLGSRPLVA